MEKVLKKVSEYQYSEDDKIGQGQYGVVYKGVSTKTQQPVAIKKISNSLFSTPKFQELVMREIQVAQTVNHPNIVNCLSAVRTANNLYIVTEYCDGFNLEKYLNKNKNISEEQSIKFLQQIISGYYSLYEKNVIHRDIKPANLIFNGDSLKICDLGFARIVDDDCKEGSMTILGTPLYMSPQLLLCENYTSKCDIWALGFVFYEMLFGKTPWSGSSQKELFNNITKNPLTFLSKPETKEETKDLLRKMLAIEEVDRISWSELFQDSIISAGLNKGSEAK